jgi:hypothetical protein
MKQPCNCEKYSYYEYIDDSDDFDAFDDDYDRKLEEYEEMMRDDI